MKTFFVNWFPVIIFAGIIFTLSSFPLGVPDSSDKFLHFFIYALMGIFTTRAVMLTWGLSAGMSFFFGGSVAILFGIFDELHQSFVPGRQATVGDGIADSIGALCGSLLFVLIFIRFLKPRRKRSESENNIQNPI